MFLNSVNNQQSTDLFLGSMGNVKNALITTFVVIFFIIPQNVTEGFPDCSINTYGYLDEYHHCGNFVCRPPFICCVNGCCYDGDVEDLYTTPELLGLILNISAIIVAVLMWIVMCGATYCSPKQDESSIFGKRA